MSSQSRGRNAQVQFSLSTASSATSSRESSPASLNGFVRANGFNEKVKGRVYDNADYYDRKNENKSPYSVLEASIPGKLPRDVYDSTLPWWRARIRRQLLKTVKWESEVLARMQENIRTPWLDAYFVYTSSLGTHTFFMILLPAFFFFGYGEMGRGLLIVLGLGIYLSSVVKDLICAPRPFAPPVTRLTIGSHHLEYGFPSTHSTNSVSIALLLFAHVHRLASIPTFPSTFPGMLSNSTLGPFITQDSSTDITPVISPQMFIFLSVLLAIYTFSIVFGRLYTAMHSFTDCAMGILLGAGIWWGHSSWSGIPLVISSSNPFIWFATILRLGVPYNTGGRLVYIGQGLGAGDYIEGWLQRGGWEVPLILIPLCLLLVNQHPQPVDDCPCFEDAIACMSAVTGALVGRWAMAYGGIVMGLGQYAVMPGSGWVYELNQWMPIERNLVDVGIWWGVATIKMVVGVLTIFAWRLLAKSALHLVLPPTFRLLARAFRLPHRRFYTPATEYKNVPSEFNTPNGFGLHPIPSVIDLPGTAGVGVEVGGIGSGYDSVSGRGIKLRMVPGSGLNPASNRGNGVPDTINVEEKEKPEEQSKHYDADVLTKVIVYGGIAVLATEALPFMFEMVGWGVKSWA